MKFLKHNRHSLLSGVALAIVYIGFDLLFRLGISDQHTTTTNVELPMLNEVEIQQTKTNDIVGLFAEFDIEKKQIKTDVTDKTKNILPKKVGIGQEKEQKQHGQLSQLYFGENKVTLTGIFFNSERFAVVSFYHLVNKSSTIKKLTEGQKLFDYTVTRIQPQSISLIRNSQKIELKLFKK